MQRASMRVQSEGYCMSSDDNEFVSPQQMAYYSMKVAVSE